MKVKSNNAVEKLRAPVINRFLREGAKARNADELANFINYSFTRKSGLPTVIMQMGQNTFRNATNFLYLNLFDRELAARQPYNDQQNYKQEVVRLLNGTSGSDTAPKISTVHLQKTKAGQKKAQNYQSYLKLQAIDKDLGISSEFNPKQDYVHQWRRQQRMAGSYHFAGSDRSITNLFNAVTFKYSDEFMGDAVSEFEPIDLSNTNVTKLW